MAANGYRHDDLLALIRLQPILLLLQFGMALPAIAETLAGEVSEQAVLRAHRL